MPRSACSARFLPSKPNGRVTTPTVSAPSSRASSAITGAAPVPVPPPSPAVTNTMSAPLSASLSWSRLSIAASRPTSGLAPAPRPRVTFWPTAILTSASVIRSACASVLTAMNSTPRSPLSTMRLTAFVPPPPTPTTLMTARYDPPVSFIDTDSPSLRSRSSRYRNAVYDQVAHCASGAILSGFAPFVQLLRRAPRSARSRRAA